jgi:2,3-bisphosphoglycerate-independent phosphoglycerate mutase
MKYVILHVEGVTDTPRQELGGDTPLQAAATPNLDQLSRQAELGVVAPVGERGRYDSGMTGLAILGYDPKKFYPGPAPLEAVSLGVAAGEHDVVYRATMVTLRAEPDAKGRGAAAALKKLTPQTVMEDASAGGIETESARDLIDAVNEQLGSETIQFYPGTGHRHLMVWVNGKARVVCQDPRNVVGQPIGASLPSGDGSDMLRKLMDASLVILRDHPINDERKAAGKQPANCLWLWGQGRAPSWPSLTERYSLVGATLAWSDVHRGIGISAGLDPVTVEPPGDDEEAALRKVCEAAVAQLAKRDLLHVHVGLMPGDSGTAKAQDKVARIETFDRIFLGPFIEGIDKQGAHRLLLVADSSDGSVGGQGQAPILYAYRETPAKKAGQNARRFHEAGAKVAAAGPREAAKLVGRMLARG